MKNTKRIALVLLAGLMVFGLAACAIETGEETDATTAADAVSETTAKITAATTAAATTAEPEPEPIVLKIIAANVQNANYDKSGEATIEAKYKKLADAFSATSPDVVFLPECGTSDAAEGIRSRMANASDYEAVTGESVGSNVMMLYNKKVFTLVSQGCQKIGAKDDENGSKYDRYLVWAKLRHKESDAQIVVVPIHVDYATEACKAQINLIVNYLKTNFPKIPFILGGDFNLEMSTINKTDLVSEGYQNAGSTATRKINGGAATFPDKGTVIDFVWYKSGMIYKAKATTYKVIMDALPTDHRPIYVEIELKK